MQTTTATIDTLRAAVTEAVEKKSPDEAKLRRQWQTFLIDSFLAPDRRTTFEYRLRAECFHREALEIAMHAEEGPALRSTIEGLLKNADFGHTRISTTVADLERQVWLGLMAALRSLARDRDNRAPEIRLAAWDALDRVRNAKPQS